MPAITPKDNLLRAIYHKDPQWVPHGLETVVRIDPPVVERPNLADVDAFGVRWAYEDAAEGGTYPEVGGHTITDITRWREQISMPDLEHLDWEPILNKAASVDRENQLIMGFFEMGLFERSYLLLGMEEALIAYMEHPQEMEQMISAIADYKIELISMFHERIKPEIIWYGDDWGTQHGLFIPPHVWRDIIKPHTKRIYDCISERGMIVYQHSCGKIEAVFGDMVEMGAQIFNPCQPCNDLAAMKKAYAGRIAFHGGIDSQFVLDRPGVTPDEVRTEVRRRIDEMADGGGYIADPSHAVPFDPELIEAMRDEISRYGTY